MISFLLAVALATVTSADAPQDYADAYQESVDEQKPLMVIVSAPWCNACRSLKESTIRPMARTGELDDVSLTVINPEEDPALAARLTRGETLIPQIIVYTPGKGRWQRRKLSGFQSKQPVRQLIRRALGSG